MATIDQIQIPSGTYDMSVKDEYILWGGPNKASSYGCIDAALVGNLRGNRLACISGSAITVEYSRDAGSTWIDYGLTNAQKGAIFAQGGSALIGKANSTNKATANGNRYQLRITIDTHTAYLYTQLLKTVIYCSTDGSYDCKCQIQGVLRGSSTFTNITDAIAISGWSGYNVINHNFTAGNSYNGQYNKVRYLFTANGGDTNFNGLDIKRIMSFGGVGWACPSTIALTDHLYTYDQDQNANFPGNVRATGGFTGDLAGNATTATTATKLGTSTVGGTTTPIYLNAGVPTALAYTIAKSVPSDAKFTDTTYSSQAAASGGTAVSLVTTGEKYTWNNKSNLAIGTTATTAAAGNHTHTTSIAISSGTSQLSLSAGGKYALTAGGKSFIFTAPKGIASSDRFSHASSARNMPVHSYYYNTNTGELIIKLDSSDLGDTSRLWISVYTPDNSEITFDASIPLIDIDTSNGYSILSTPLWITDSDSVYKSMPGYEIELDFNHIHTLFSYIRRIISSSNPYTNLFDYLDGMDVDIYIYVTK